jgi:hypothetical protein
MSRTRDESEELPRFDDETNPNINVEGSKTGAIADATLKDLKRRLQKLIAENNMLRRKAKGKKTKEGSSSSEEEDSSLEDDVSKKGKKRKNNQNKSSYNSMSFNYDNMPSTTAYTSIPFGKAPYFYRTCYNQWKHCMKKYVYSISSEVWQVVCDGVDFSNEDEQPIADQLQKIYHNTQAISIPTSSIDKEEFNRVDGLDVVKDLWNTLRMAFEGSRPMRKAKVEMLEGQLNHFIMYDNEMPHEMFNQLKKVVNKARAYIPMNYNVVASIQQDPTYKKMSFNDVLGRIMNHKMNIQEANNIKNLYKSVSTSKKQDISLKANKSKKKKVLIESPSEKEEEDEREYDEDKVVLFNKFIKKRRTYRRDRREKSRSKRVCYNCGKNWHFITQCSYERKEEDNENKKKLVKGYKKDNKFTKKKTNGQAHVGQEWNSSDESSES